jgi:hypothetical protein
VDHAAGIFEHPSMSGLLIGLLAGGGGAAALLAVFWRPPAQKES